MSTVYILEILEYFVTILMMTSVITLMVMMLFLCYAVMLKDLMTKLSVCIDVKMKMKQNTKVLSFVFVRYDRSSLHQ